MTLEQTGKITRDQPTKFQSAQNSWVICLAPDASFAEIAEPAPKYTAEDLVNDIKEALKSRGTMGIRGLARLFKIMDNNGNKQLDRAEFAQGLGEMGIGLTAE